MAHITASPAQQVPILTSARELLARYPVLFCDVWGVVHNGATAYGEACAVLGAYRKSGGVVVLVSNAPRTAPVVARILEEKRVPRSAWDVIVSSGEITVRHIAKAGYETIHHVGPERDRDLIEVIGLPETSLEAADALVVTGLIDDRRERGEDYRGRLEMALERRLPLICANPDLEVDVGGVFLPCAGAIATVYEAMGGTVVWAGKPFTEPYALAHQLAEEWLARPVGPSEILAIGDAMRTDVAGAGRYGIASLLIGQGIHRDTLMPNGTLSPDALHALVTDADYRPIAAIEGLR
ncbi:MAG: TIGR01459 family HAD-type hydrolase [Hyphomicrobiaceae bacterium]